MPQLDQLTYCTQIVWLCISFFGYYVLVYNYGLPKISRLLKLRARLLSHGRGNGLSRENSFVSDISHQGPHGRVEPVKGSVQGISEPSVLSDCAHYLNNSVAGASEWCNRMVAELNANQLESANKKYVRSLTEINVSHYSKCKALANLTALTSDSIRVTGSFQTRPDKVSNWKSSNVGGLSVLNALLILRLRKHSLVYLNGDHGRDKKQIWTQSLNLKSQRQKKVNKKNA